MDFEFYGGALESPQEATDFVAGNLIRDGVIPNIEDLPEKINFDPDGQVISSQGSSVACTAFSATNAVEATVYAQSGKRISIDAYDQYRYQTKVHPKTAGPNGDWTKSSGRALVHRSQNDGGIPAVNLETNKNTVVPVIAFAKIPRNATSFRQYIAGKFAIQISADVRIPPGGGESNWIMARKTGVLEMPKEWITVGGHAVAIVIGYDFSEGEGYFICANSYGPTWGAYRNGTFRIYEREIENLHASANVFFIEKDFLKPSIYRDVPEDHWAAESIKRLLELGIMKGSNSENIDNPVHRNFYPEEPVTRAELAVVVDRLYKNIKS